MGQGRVRQAVPVGLRDPGRSRSAEAGNSGRAVSWASTGTILERSFARPRLRSPSKRSLRLPVRPSGIELERTGREQPAAASKPFHPGSGQGFQSRLGTLGRAPAAPIHGPACGAAAGGASVPSWSLNGGWEAEWNARGGLETVVPRDRSSLTLEPRERNRMERFTWSLECKRADDRSKRVPEGIRWTHQRVPGASEVAQAARSLRSDGSPDGPRPLGATQAASCPALQVGPAFMEPVEKISIKPSPAPRSTSSGRARSRICGSGTSSPVHAAASPGRWPPHRPSCR